MVEPVRQGRRDLLTSTAGLSLEAGMSPFLLSCATAEGRTAPSPVVDPSAEKVRGAILDGIYDFRATPYGAPTDGTNRFKPPQRRAPWTGVREALAWGPSGAGRQRFRERTELERLKST